MIRRASQQPAEPAIYVASHLVTARRRSPDVVMAAPLRTSHGFAVTESAFAAAARPALELHFISPTAPGGLTVPWSQTRSSLWVPEDVAYEERFRDSMSMKLLVTPDEVFAAADPAALRRRAWNILTSADPSFVAFIAAQLAALVEVPVLLRDRFNEMAAGMDLPRAASARLAVAVQEGEEIFDQRVLRWVISECAAAQRAAAWLPARTRTHHDLVLERLVAPAVRSGTTPTVPQIITALWLLHAGGVGDDDTPVLGVVTALGYQSARKPLGWTDAAERARRHWSVEDDHPVVRRASPKPSTLAQAIRRKVGLDPTAVLSGVFHLGGMMLSAATEGYPPIVDRSDWSTGLLSELEPVFRTVIEDRLSWSLDELADAVLGEADDYRGLGSLHRTGAEAVWRRPLLRFGDTLVLTGFQSLIGASDQLLRVVSGALPGTPSDSTLGFMLEASAVDQLQSLSSRHTVISSDEIDAVVARGQKRCDAIVVSDGRWLLIEVGAMTPKPSERLGSHRDVVRRCRDYHDKLDQADAMELHLDRIARSRGISPPREVVKIVVTADPIFGTPALIAELSVQRPTRNPYFVVSVDEIDDLVRLGQVSDVPLQVAIWQQHQRHAALGGSIAEAMRVIRPPKRHLDPDLWTSLLPRRRPEAA